ACVVRELFERDAQRWSVRLTCIVRREKKRASEEPDGHRCPQKDDAPRTRSSFEELGTSGRSINVRTESRDNRHEDQDRGENERWLRERRTDSRAHEDRTRRKESNSRPPCWRARQVITATGRPQ